jgi:2-hydroxy-3-keto-5-methylthiopentenyl-1-phosphate phosphatase
MSDFCPALFADVVFARGELVDWCRSRGIGYIPYGDLFELRQRLEELLRRRRLFQRYLPLRRRQRAWVEE